MLFRFMRFSERFRHSIMRFGGRRSRYLVAGRVYNRVDVNVADQAHGGNTKLQSWEIDIMISAYQLCKK